ncbi:hypothetical protein GCM10009745_51490 [Kribbella yunnanensis]|uniref:Uncharacterized protein n=1 Tax=Kribbella yunnanensis TaxID=190194 RepID=A0ABN2I4W5_9ACTN
MNALTTKIPPTVIASIRNMNTGLPESPLTVPASIARINVIQKTSGHPPCCCTSSGTSQITSTETTSTSNVDANPSHPTNAGVPRDIVLSNQYRARARHISSSSPSPEPGDYRRPKGHRLRRRQI